MESDFVIVLTTFPADQDPASLATTLVDEMLAACVNVLPVMQSVYRWHGAIERADERQLVIKTSRLRLPALETRLKELHPYEVPEFLVLAVLTGSPEYLSWLSDATSGASPRT